VLVAAIVCLLVAMLVGAGLVRSLAVQHRVSRDEQRHLQALWLAESAVQRAWVRCENDAAYEGETWQVKLRSASGLRTAKVVIEVSGQDNQSDGRRVRIEAIWPDDPLYRSVRHREFVIPGNREGDAS
jgi:type II secretory pathway component PulK